MQRVIFCLAFCAACAAHNARAFVLTGYKWPQPSPGAAITLTYSFSNLFDGGMLDQNDQPVPMAQLRSSVEEALGLWASVVPLNFVELPDAGPPATDAEYYNFGAYPQIRIGHHFIDSFGNNKAHAYYPYSPTGGLAGDVHFDDSDRWNLIGTLAYPDVLGAAEHELGHSLGLDHAGASTSIMYPTFVRMQGLGTGYLSDDDIAGIRAIYGAGVGSVKPLPEPSSVALLAVGIAISVWARYGRWPRGRLRLNLDPPVI
ncbi:MAG: matrixin family metalloprotease [Planctomycetia bacterium]|nr:matrixin family metalloprotease [Planctomycetia bacterium]